MNRVNKIKIKAFTFVEITIAMLLVAIIAGFAYFMLNTFIQASKKQQDFKQKKYSLELLLHRLHVDWTNAESIHFDNHTLILQDSIGTIQYVFSDSLILRDQYTLRQDSFAFITQDIYTEHIDSPNEGNQLITKIHIQLAYANKLFPIELNKVYSATQLLGSTNSMKYDTD